MIAIDKGIYERDNVVKEIRFAIFRSKLPEGVGNRCQLKLAFTYMFSRKRACY